VGDLLASGDREFKLIKFLICGALAFLPFSRSFSALYFSALQCVHILKTRVVTRVFQISTKYQSRNYFVECGESRVLTFTPVVEKNVTRGRAKS
jgi:hypothetical protein